MERLQRIIERHAELWRTLRSEFVVVSASRAAGSAFHRGGDCAAEAKLLSEAGVEAELLRVLCTELARDHPKRACLIDMLQAASRVKEQGLEPSQALWRARVRYQGTDGVRGKVADDDGQETPLAKLVRRGEFTPGLCELLCAGVMLRRGITGSPTVVIAEDGRDAFGGRQYVKAAIRAFGRFGSRVFDLGIAATPLVPVAAAELGAQVGAVITASHNPADQNGVKFFIDGRKPLPETDDYPLSAFTFVAALEGLPAQRGPARVERVDAGRMMREYISTALAEADVRALRKARLVIDVAHGAFAPFADDLVDGLGLRAQVIHADMTGENINRDSGVAYIEGRERIAGCDVDVEIAVVGKVRTLARESAEPVFGIALDADGDRGLLLLYDERTDEVRIIDGDRIAFLLARLAEEEGTTGGGVFAGTVESDLAVFDAVRRLGMETVLTPVGDKWLSSRPELTEKLFVGEESSGHLVWPVAVHTASGTRTVVTGNGLLTGLRGAAAMLRLGLAPADAAEPYAAGVVKTFYTYFVDHARFHRDGTVWREDLEIARNEWEKLKAAGAMPSGSRLREVDFEDDPDMLYLNVEERGRVLGAIFARNSGTESKTVTYARGAAEYEKPLVTMARAVNENHIRKLKDMSLAEARAGQAIAEAVAHRGSVTLQEARAVAEGQGIMGETALTSLLFALAREGRARQAGGEILALNE